MGETLSDERLANGSTAIPAGDGAAERQAALAESAGDDSPENAGRYPRQAM